MSFPEIANLTDYQIRQILFRPLPGSDEDTGDTDPPPEVWRPALPQENVEIEEEDFLDAVNAARAEWGMEPVEELL